MQKKKVTGRLAEYILRQKISVDQISRDTGIPRDKLLLPVREHLTAEEFLKLCAYLRIEPGSNEF